MNTAMIFAILGIEETKDEEKIRNAYREKLSSHNPEDDPDGFRRLREAYEQALAYTKETDADEEAPEDNSPSGLWMKRAADVYFHLSKRLDDGEWQALLKDDLCLDLEYGEEIKWKLFTFLAGHHRLNASTYRILDEFFHIEKEADAFKEELPEGFVDYMLHKIQDLDGSEDFPYEWAEGADDADYDGFQDELYQLENLLYENKWEEAEQTAAAMERLDIKHPYYRLAKARLLAHQGDMTAAEEAKALFEAYEESIKIRAYGMEILWDCGRHEEAAEGFYTLEEQFGPYYMIEKYLTFHEREQGHLAEALHHCFRALQNSSDDSLYQLREDLDKEFIAQCEEALAAGTLTQDDASRLCSSYIRMAQNQKGIDFILNHPEYSLEMERVHKYLAMFFYQEELFEKGEQESRLWQQAAAADIAGEESKTQDVKENEEDKTQDAKEGEEDKLQDDKEALDEYYLELCTAYSIQAKCLMGMAGRTEDHEKSAALNRQAEQSLEKALEYRSNHLPVRQELLDLLISEQEYERAIALADEILALDDSWFPALVQKQKACYELKRAQEVVDIFYQAKNIYQSYPGIYEQAAQVFMDYGQTEDVERILTQAKEAEVESLDLDLTALHCERVRCQTDVSYFQALRNAEQLLQKFQENNADDRLIGSLYFEMAIIEDCQYYEEFIHPGKAEEYIKKAIDLRQKEPLWHYCDYYYVCGCILKHEGKYTEALDAYEKFVSGYEMTENAAMNMASCQDKLGQWEEAVKLYKQALSINPEQESANIRIAVIYKKIDNDNDSIPILKKALPFMNRQIELTPDSPDDYWYRGIIHRRLGLLDKAMEDAEQALALNKNFFLGLNLKGKLLYYQGKYPMALFYLKKALAALEKPKENGNGLAVCSNGMKVCLKMGKLDQAEEWLRKGIDMLEGDDQAWCFKQLAELREEQGEFDDALRLFKESFDKGLISEALYHEYCLSTKTARCWKLEPQEIHQLEQEALQLAQKYNSIELWETLSDIQYYFLPDLEKALDTKKTVMERAAQENDWWEHMEKIMERMRIYWELGDNEAVNRLKKLYQRAIGEHYRYETKEFPPMEQYLNHPYTGREHACDMVKYWIFTGRMDLAAKGLEKLKQMSSCLECSRRTCSSLPKVLALYHEALGEPEKAYQYYKALLTLLPNHYLGHYKIRQLGRKIGLPSE